jgi:glycerol-3-phosphate acyltransferase PlsY
MMPPLPPLLVLAAYLAGSVPFGLLVGRLRGVDVRAHGSGNIGATNVARALGKGWGVLVLLLDLAKGWAPLWLAQSLLAADLPSRPWWIGATLLAAVLGHVFSVFLRFRGGKGVATALGVTLAVCPWAALVGSGGYLVLYLTTRISSLGSLGGTAAAVGASWLFAVPAPVGGALVLVALVILWRHRDNLRRLRRGEEKPV